MATLTEDQVLALPKSIWGSIAYLLKIIVICAFMMTHVFALYTLVGYLFPQQEQLAIYAPAISGIVLGLLLGKALFVRSDFLTLLLDNGLRRTPRMSQT